MILPCVAFFVLGSVARLEADEKIVIGFSQATMNHPWRVAMVDGNEKYAAENYPDVDLVVTDGQKPSYETGKRCRKSDDSRNQGPDYQSTASASTDPRRETSDGGKNPCGYARPRG